MRNYYLTEFVKPSTWRLFEAIDRFLEMTHILPLDSNPGGSAVYTISLRSPCRNTFLTSSW